MEQRLQPELPRAAYLVRLFTVYNGVPTLAEGRIGTDLGCGSKHQGRFSDTTRSDDEQMLIGPGGVFPKHLQYVLQFRRAGDEGPHQDLVAEKRRVVLHEISDHGSGPPLKGWRIA